MPGPITEVGHHCQVCSGTDLEGQVGKSLVILGKAGMVGTDRDLIIHLEYGRRHRLQRDFSSPAAQSGDGFQVSHG